MTLAFRTTEIEYPEMVLTLFEQLCCTGRDPFAPAPAPPPLCSCSCLFQLIIFQKGAKIIHSYLSFVQNLIYQRMFTT